MQIAVAARHSVFLSTCLFLLAACGGGSGGGGGGPSGPQANGDTYTLARGGTLTIPAPGVLGNDTGGTGGALSATLVTNVAHGTLSLNSDGSFTYRHDGSTSSDTFAYRATAGSSSSNTATVTLALSTPVALDGCHSFAANTTFSGRLSANSASLTYEIVTWPAKGALSTDSVGNFTYTPRTNVRGLDQFTFRARDGSGQLSNTARVSLFIDGILRVMPLGDSITLGTYTSTTPSPSQSIGYRRRLYSTLVTHANGRYTVDFVGTLQNGAGAQLNDPDHEGHGGLTAQEIADNVGGWLSSRPPDVVLLHIGTNDISVNPNATAAPVSNILQNIENWEQTNHRTWVFVARIVQRLDGRGVTSFNDDLAARVAARGNDRMFVVNQETGAGLVYATTGDMADDLHPNQSGYDKMAEKWRADLLATGVLPSCP